MERYLPKHMASSAYIIEDSIVDPQKRTMTTLTWNISHARLMVWQRVATSSRIVLQSDNIPSHCFCPLLLLVSSLWKSAACTKLTLRTAAGLR